LSPNRPAGDLAIDPVLANQQGVPAVAPVLRNVWGNDENLDRFVGADADEVAVLAVARTAGALRQRLCGSWMA
jgi:hypothetical protein